MSISQLAPPTCIVRNTASRKGRTCSVAPGATAARHLYYGRIILEAGDAPIRFTNAGMETGLICLSGQATVLVDDASSELGRFDTLYVPRDASIEVKPHAGGC